MGIVKRTFAFIRGILSEPDGTPSSTRVLMYLFSGFSMWLLWRCFYHIFQIHDTTMLTIWLSNMPLLVTTLIGLISLPYGINKGSATFSDIATMVANAKQGNLQASIGGNLSDLKGMFAKAPAPIPDAPPAAAAAAPTPPAAPATGSPGVKG